MPTDPGNTTTVPDLPASSWSRLHKYLTGAAKSGPTLPDQIVTLQGHGNRLPTVLASQLWARKTTG